MHYLHGRSERRRDSALVVLYSHRLWEAFQDLQSRSYCHYRCLVLLGLGLLLCSLALQDRLLRLLCDWRVHQLCRRRPLGMHDLWLAAQLVPALGRWCDYDCWRC